MIILGFDDIEMPQDKADFINKLLAEQKSDLRLEPFKSLKADQFPVEAIELKKDQMGRDVAFKSYRNSTGFSSMKRKNESLMNNLDNCLNDAKEFNLFLRRKRKAYTKENKDVKENCEEIGDMDLLQEIFEQKPKENKKKRKNHQNNFNNKIKYTYLKDIYDERKKNYLNSNLKYTNINNNTKQGSSLNGYFDWYSNDDYNQTKNKFNRNTKCKRPMSNGDHYFDNYRDDSSSNIDEANLFMNGGTNCKKSFNLNKNFNNSINNNNDDFDYRKNFKNFNNIENEFPQEPNFELKSRNNSFLSADHNTRNNLNRKQIDKEFFNKESLLKAKPAINKISNNSNYFWNFSRERQNEEVDNSDVMNLLLASHKDEKEALSNNPSSEKTDINAIKRENSSPSAISVRSRTKNEFETVKLGNQEIKVSNLPQQMQLRDKKIKSPDNNKNNTKNNNKSSAKQDAKSINSFTNNHNNKARNHFKTNSFENSTLDIKSFNSNYKNNYSFINSIDDNHNRNNYFRNYYYEESTNQNEFFTRKDLEEMEKRIIDFIDKRFKAESIKQKSRETLNKKESDRKLEKLALRLLDILNQKNNKLSSLRKTEKKEKAQGKDNNLNANGNANENHAQKEKRGRKPKRLKITQQEREELNLKIDLVKKDSRFIKGFKILFNIEGQQEYSFNPYELKDDLFIKLRSLVEETIVKLNDEDDQRKNANRNSDNNNINNNLSENFDARSALSPNLVINNKLNPMPFKHILDDSVSASSMSDSSFSNKSNS